MTQATTTLTRTGVRQAVKRSTFRAISPKNQWPFEVRPRRLLTMMAPVPEPGTWTLMLLGLAGTGVAARRQRRR